MRKAPYPNRSPLPADLEAAHTEILKLRMQLVQQNERWGSRFVDLECDRRSVAYQLKRCQQKLEKQGVPA